VRMVPGSSETHLIAVQLAAIISMRAARRRRVQHASGRTGKIRDECNQYAALGRALPPLTASARPSAHPVPCPCRLLRGGLLLEPKLCSQASGEDVPAELARVRQLTQPSAQSGGWQFGCWPEWLPSTEYDRLFEND